MPEVIAALVALTILTCSVATSPGRAQCPTGGWWLAEGIRQDGSFWCYAPQKMKCCGEPSGPCTDDCPSVLKVGGQIHCTNGTRAIVVDYRTVGCQR